MPFNVGDAIRIKGRPEHSMTVVGIEEDWVICRWFDNSAVQEEAFSADDLEHIPEASD
jgi:uncharacterized protein YodC (DUF2158 family)